MFDFTFPWYLLLSVWVAVWHSVILRLWLGPELAAAVEPLFTPVIIASCFAAISNISTAQLGSLNRVGTGLFFNVAAVCLFVLAVILGWRWGGIVGVAWALVVARLVGVVQDLFVTVLVNAGGWLARSTWKQMGIQIALGLAFSGCHLLWHRDSYWQLIPATLHGGLVAGFLSRKWVARGLIKLKGDLAPRPI